MTKYSSGAWAEDDQPLPEPTFFRKIFEDLWEGLFVLVVWGFLIWLLGLAAILIGLVSQPLGLIVAALTIAPALAGLMAACARGARGGFLRLGEAWRGTFHLYGRSVALALPLAILMALILVTRDVVAMTPGRSEMVASWALQVGVTLTVVVMHIYLYPVLALYDTSLKRTVLLAGVLAAKFIGQTLALLVFGAVLLAATLFHPLIWMLILGPWCVVTTNATYRLARRILPDPRAIDK